MVSNYNSKANVQGTGTTIVEISPTGSTQLFAHIVAHPPAAMRVLAESDSRTALGILPGGWGWWSAVFRPLVVENMPRQDPAGCLIVLNDQGTAVETITNKDIVGPWDLTMKANATSAELFVSNALGGNTSTDHGVPVAGNFTVVRLDLALARPPHRCSPARL